MRYSAIMTFPLLAALALTSPASTQDSRPGVAVMPFENGGSYGQDAENFDALQVGLQQILLTEMARNSNLRIVERSRLNDLIREQDLGEAGRVDANTAARLGRLVGAKFMVLGSFVDFYGDFRIDVRVVDVETSEIINTNQVSDRREELYQMVVELAGNLTEDVDLPALEDVEELEQQAREIPTEALTYYSRAIYFEDEGQTERAIQMYSRAVEEFPDYSEAQERLQQLRQS
ncbi:MAG: tetratricopeptide repeat protein [Gemmatimonadota bacterium]|nr:tetratricopeptide repeat protein [Gemmatimonadota bacterium]MDH5803675.1 tetratricopeptide repeat protein [Gemmatimonadota bacterium]